MTITLPEETYRRLEEAALRRHVSVEEFLTETFALPATPQLSEEIQRRLAALEETRKLAAARASMYPPGFQVDDSREAIYFGEE